MSCKILSATTAKCEAGAYFSTCTGGRRATLFLHEEAPAEFPGRGPVPAVLFVPSSSISSTAHTESRVSPTHRGNLAQASAGANNGKDMVLRALTLLCQCILKIAREFHGCKKRLMSTRGVVVCEQFVRPAVSICRSVQMHDMSDSVASLLHLLDACTQFLWAVVGPCHCLVQLYWY